MWLVCALRSGWKFACLPKINCLPFSIFITFFSDHSFSEHETTSLKALISYRFIYIFHLKLRYKLENYNLSSHDITSGNLDSLKYNHSGLSWELTSQAGTPSHAGLLHLVAIIDWYCISTCPMVAMTSTKKTGLRLQPPQGYDEWQQSSTCLPPPYWVTLGIVLWVLLLDKPLTPASRSMSLLLPMLLLAPRLMPACCTWLIDCHPDILSCSSPPHWWAQNSLSHNLECKVVSLVLDTAAAV